MVWGSVEIEKFENAINNYRYPKVYLDLETNIEVMVSTFDHLEKIISKQLYSQNLSIIKAGLANIVYWGNARAGYRDVRVNKFIEGITDDQLMNFRKLIAESNNPTLAKLKKLGMPQFSGISFLSKITTFLDPSERCVLDLQIARLSLSNSTKSLSRLKQWTSIPVTRSNEEIYLEWCNECKQISNKYFSGHFRPVDIERGFFYLIENKKEFGIECAQKMYESA